MNTPQTLPLILTDERRAQFERHGVLRLPGLLPRPHAEAMADRLWSAMASSHGVGRDDRATWTVQRPAGFQALERSGGFRELDDPAFRALFDAFLGAGQWNEPPHWGAALVTFPDTVRPWDVPFRNWHIDLPASGAGDDLSLLRAFAFLNEVRPRGGGTLYIAGSHRVVMDRARAAGPESLRSAQMRERLKVEEPWLAALWSKEDREDRIERFMVRGGRARGVDLRVEEMTGAPGDVIVMHPCMFHTIAPNALDQPRLMVVQAMYRRA